MGKEEEDEEEDEEEEEEEFSLQILYPLTTLRENPSPVCLSLSVRDLRSLSSHGHLCK